MDEWIADWLSQLCGWGDEWADWAVADGAGGGNDGADGAPVSFARMSAAEFVISFVPRVAQPHHKPLCSELLAAVGEAPDEHRCCHAARPEARARAKHSIEQLTTAQRPCCAGGAPG